jgi:hypothetical protein
MDKVDQSIQMLSEDLFAYVWDKIYDINVNKLPFPHDYVQKDKAIIEKEFNSKRVKQVQYRNQPVKVLEEFEDGVVKVVGYCSDKDFPLENIKVPK